MKPLVEVKREKKIYKLTNEEFISGKWIEIIKTKQPKPTKFDVQYKNGFLSILFYYKYPEKGGDIDGDNQIGRRDNKS